MPLPAEIIQPENNRQKDKQKQYGAEAHRGTSCPKCCITTAGLLSGYLFLCKTLLP